MVDDIHFEPLPETNTNFPWFDRSLLTRIASFGPDKDGFVAYVTPDALLDLEDGTKRQAPAEAFGQLMGRVYKDGNGVFTLVTGAVYASHLSSSSGHVKLTAEEMGALRREANLIHPAADFVGWTHSHLSYGKYSSVDLEEQKTWSEDHNLGILTFMDGSAWPIVYRGPTAHRLFPQNAPAIFTNMAPQALEETVELKADESPISLVPEEQIPSSEPLLSDQASSSSVQHHPGKTTELGVEAAPGFPAQFARRQDPLLFVIVAWLLVLTLGFAFFGFGISQMLSTIHTQLAPPLPASLQWTCDQQQGVAPLQISCSGPVGQGITGWQWNFSDGPLVNGSVATHVYESPGAYKIQLTVISSTGSLDAGSVEIQVLPKPKS